MDNLVRETVVGWNTVTSEKPGTSCSVWWTWLLPLRHLYFSWDHFVKGFAHIYCQHVDCSLIQEGLVWSVIDLLATKVPKVKPIFGRPSFDIFEDVCTHVFHLLGKDSCVTWCYEIHITLFHLINFCIRYSLLLYIYLHSLLILWSSSLPSGTLCHLCIADGYSRFVERSSSASSNNFLVGLMPLSTTFYCKEISL